VASKPPSLGATQELCHVSRLWLVCETEAAESGSRCDEVGSAETTQGRRYKAGVRLFTGEAFNGVISRIFLCQTWSKCQKFMIVAVFNNQPDHFVSALEL